MESKAERKLRKVCTTAKMYEDAAEKSMATMTHVYGYNQRVIVNTLVSERTFVEHAQGLAGNLTSLRKRSSRLSQKLVELHGIVRKQMEDLYRTEVDIDMKLRACYGSCRAVLPFSVDPLGYQTLQTDMDETDRTLNQRRKAATPPEHIPRIKLQPVDVSPAASAEYNSVPTVRGKLLTQFEDLGANRVVLEALDPAELD
ncbi:fibrinogen alpha chain [Sander lucioperca]|uniref:fibrinogen alpha chain n=1 Tax=Sander lucioperca TaxID=283035 RepID=UPI00125E704B|nr:fibrinogen alpha chain [Sander lucioperca]